MASPPATHAHACRAVGGRHQLRTRRPLPSLQVSLLLSCCPCEGRISGIVDVPNAVATLAIPIAIFDQDVRPKKGGPPTGPQLVLRGDVAKSTYDGDNVTFRNPCGCR